jgi:tetratricopeptide (TPR) repeat protein
MGVLHAIGSGAGWREFGPFVTPNIFASYLVTVLPVAFLMAVRSLSKAGSPEREPRTPVNLAVVMFGIVALGAGFTALLMTGSKGAVASLGVSVAVVFAVTRPWRRLRRAMVGLSVLMLIFACGIGGRTLLGRVESSGGTEAHSSQFRLLTWKGAAHMAMAHPVAGTGIGTFGSVFNQYAIAGWTQAAHNAYLQAADETGIPGLLLFLAALGAAGTALWRNARGRDLVAIGVLAGLLAAAMHNCVDYGWSLWGPAAVLWGLIGLGLVERTDVKPAKWCVALIGLVLIAALAGNIVLANAAAISEPALDRQNRLTPDERVSALRSARDLDPLDGLLARELGVALAEAGDQHGALATLTEATRLTPNDPVAWRLLGEGYENQGVNQQAMAAFNQGLQRSPASFKILLDAARLSERTPGGTAASLGFYQRLVAAAEGPVGEYPATPEIVDTEPLYAYAALAADADRRGDRTAAAGYRRALVALADRFEANRKKYALMWQATGKDDPRDLEDVQRLRAEALRALLSDSNET